MTGAGILPISSCASLKKGGYEDMRKTVLLLSTMASAMLLASEVTWAANVQGTGGGDALTDTTSRDVIILSPVTIPCMQIRRILKSWRK